MPVTVEFVIEGLDRHIALLGELSDMAAFFDKPLGDWANKVKGEKLQGMSHYPPELPNQVYVRTGDLGEGFGVDRYAASAYRFGNSVDYAPAVIGDSYGRGQDAVHAGRWWTLYDVLSRELPTAVEALQEYLNQKLGAI